MILMHGEREGSGTGQREKLDRDKVTIRAYLICTKRERNIPFHFISLKLKLNFVKEFHKGKHNQKVPPFMTNSPCTRRLQCQGKDNEEA